MARKQAELEERERALLQRLQLSEQSEVSLKKQLGKVERQLESSEARRVTDEQHHDRTVEKLQNKLKEALESVVSLDESNPGAAASLQRPTSSRASVMGKWMSGKSNQ
jgi:benzoyl-CoA reductase/2-hydroxyglutaryl-CoA dehydratase subunit BcrC/BadD/HgdB